MPGAGSEYLAIGNRLVFAAYDDAAGWEPWVTDGTDGGTRRLADVGPGADSSTPRHFIRSGDFVYFSELTLKACEDGWDNDGDAASTAPIRAAGRPPRPPRARSATTASTTTATPPSISTTRTAPGWHGGRSRPDAGFSASRARSSRARSSRGAQCSPGGGRGSRSVKG